MNQSREGESMEHEDGEDDAPTGKSAVRHVSLSLKRSERGEVDPMMFAQLAVRYLEAAAREGDACPDRLIAHEPAYFLAAHAAELACKSIFLARGRSVESLKFKVGHEFAKLLDDPEHGPSLNVTPEDRETLLAMSALHKSLRFRYSESGVIRYHVWPRTIGAVERIVDLAVHEARRWLAAWAAEKDAAGNEKTPR